MPKRVLALAVPVPLIAAVLAAGCDSDSSGGAATATALTSPALETMTAATEAATVTPLPPATPGGEEPTSPPDGSTPDIRREDLTDEPSLV
ncbi:MAG: hypothetical protein U1B78_01025, partial [Dehalococcoidia bacterium]|nr:hypothetical protein [Dehalococcoidia bacterium]